MFLLGYIPFLILNNLNLNIIFRSRKGHFHFNHVTGRISVKMKKQKSWRPGKYFNIGSTWYDNGELLRQDTPKNQTQWVLGVRPEQDTRVFIPVLTPKKLTLQW